MSDKTMDQNKKDVQKTWTEKWKIGANQHIVTKVREKSSEKNRNNKMS